MVICHIDVKPELIKDLAEGMLSRYKDNSVLVVPAVRRLETYAPNRRKKCHKLVFEALIPEEAINGEEAITDFGGFVVMRVPKARIEGKYLRQVSEDLIAEVPDEEERHL